MASTTDTPAGSQTENEQLGTTSGNQSIVDRQGLENWLSEIRQHSIWATWSSKLATSKEQEAIGKLIPRLTENPLLWSLPSRASENGCDETERLVNALADLKRKATNKDKRIDWSARVEQWCDDSSQRTPTQLFAVECLAWANALSRLAPRVDQDIWLALLKLLFDRAADACCSPFAHVSAHDLLTMQLLGGELPLTLAYQFPKVDACRSLANVGRRLIAESLLELLDGEGVLRSDGTDEWRRFLACWTRCMYLERKAPGSTIPKDARLQFEWLVRQTLRLRRGNGHLIFEPLTEQMPAIDVLLRSALHIGGDDLDRELFAISTGRKKESSSVYELPTPGENSEWAEISVLRNQWSKDATYLGVAFNSANVQTELGLGDLRLWTGELHHEVSIDGTSLTSDTEWEQVCWEADEDGQYLELEMHLSEGWKIQRQLYMPLEDKFVFFADALLGTNRASIEYRCTFPWSTTISCRAEEETTEVELSARKPFGWAIPLALNEWRHAARRDGQFDGRELRIQAMGTALYAPIFFDLDPERKRKPRTWRPLTVAQELHILSKDEAVAYRVQIGKEQWAIYRSLVPANNRTFLGHNLVSEFLLGRFSAEDGTIEPLIEIE